MTSPVTTSTNGKTYPARARTAAEQTEIIRQAHRLRCGARLSERAVRDGLAQAGVRVSAGTVHRYLSAFTCPVCRAPQPPPEPQERPAPQPRAVVINRSLW